MRFRRLFVAALFSVSALYPVFAFSDNGAMNHQGEPSESLADPGYFPAIESCPKDKFWLTIANDTPFYVRVFFDEKPFSTEVYAIHPRLDITTNAGIVSAPYVLTRCAPKGEYAVRYEALGYIPMPIGHGRIEVIRGTAEYIYAHPSDYPDAQGEMLWTITESELKVVPTISAKNILHNFALIFLCLLALLVFAALLVLFILVYKNKRK